MGTQSPLLPVAHTRFEQGRQWPVLGTLESPEMTAEIHTDGVPEEALPDSRSEVRARRSNDRRATSLERMPPKDGELPGGASVEVSETHEGSPNASTLPAPLRRRAPPAGITTLEPNARGDEQQFHSIQQSPPQSAINTEAQPPSTDSQTSRLANPRTPHSSRLESSTSPPTEHRLDAQVMETDTARPVGRPTDTAGTHLREPSERAIPRGSQVRQSARPQADRLLGEPQQSLLRGSPTRYRKSNDTESRAPSVRVTIGRVEIRAVTPNTAKAPASPRPKPSAAGVSLADYLRRRSSSSERS